MKNILFLLLFISSYTAVAQKLKVYTAESLKETFSFPVRDTVQRRIFYYDRNNNVKTGIAQVVRCADKLNIGEIELCYDSGGKHIGFRAPPFFEDEAIFLSGILIETNQLLNLGN